VGSAKRILLRASRSFRHCVEGAVDADGVADGEAVPAGDPDFLSAEAPPERCPEGASPSASLEVHAGTATTASNAMTTSEARRRSDMNRRLEANK
jgi:hypothetical protein